MHLVPHANDAGFLEQHGCVFAKDGFLLGQFGRQHDRPGLSAGERELRGVLREAERPGYASRPRLADVTRDAPHLGVLEGIDTNLVVSTDEFPPVVTHPTLSARTGEVASSRLAT